MYKYGANQNIDVLEYACMSVSQAQRHLQCFKLDEVEAY